MRAHSPPYRARPPTSAKRPTISAKAAATALKTSIYTVRMQSKASSVSWPDGILASAIATLALLAWWALWLWGRSPYGHLLMHGSAHLEMAVKDHWSFAVVFVCGWAVMT